jgi:hypothetical protein
MAFVRHLGAWLNRVLLASTLQLDALKNWPHAKGRYQGSRPTHHWINIQPHYGFVFVEARAAAWREPYVG